MTTPAEDRTLQVLSEVCNVDRDELQPEIHLVRDLGLDSAITLDLLMTLEEELQVEISEVEAAGFVTVGDVLAFVREKAAG